MMMMMMMIAHVIVWKNSILPEGELDIACTCDNKVDDAVIDLDESHIVVDDMSVGDGFDALTVDDDVLDFV